jgi:hypothetical protein
LTGLCKIKLKKLGIRIIYELVRKGKLMEIIVVAARADDEVYDTCSECERSSHAAHANRTAAARIGRK